MSDLYQGDAIVHIARKGKSGEMDRYGISIQEIVDHDRILSEVRRATDLVAKEFSDWNSIKLMWIPFETTTFRDGIVTGTHESPPLFLNAVTLGLIWDLH